MGGIFLLTFTNDPNERALNPVGLVFYYGRQCLFSVILIFLLFDADTSDWLQDASLPVKIFLVTFQKKR